MERRATMARRSLNRGYKEEFDLIQPQEALQQMSEPTRKLDAFWSGRGGLTGGDELDDYMDNLGEVYIEDGHVKWNPPAELNSAIAEYFNISIQEINKKLDSELFQVDNDGNIKPVRRG
jgi:hypothetical protein